MPARSGASKCSSEHLFDAIIRLEQVSAAWIECRHNSSKSLTLSSRCNPSSSLQNLESGLILEKSSKIIKDLEQWFPKIDLNDAKVVASEFGWLQRIDASTSSEIFRTRIVGWPLNGTWDLCLTSSLVR